MKNALLSVTDKTGLEVLVSSLQSLGWSIYATSGTRAALAGVEGIKCRSVEELTGVREMMDGRVKTLSPKIFAGILARRDHPGDLADVEKNGAVLFDLVVVNLYRFEEHLGKPQIEQASFIDVGGPSLIRAAAKNSASVCVLTDPADYAPFVSELKSQGRVSAGTRQKMAAKAFSLTSSYDAMIAAEWAVGGTGVEGLRYGENPHQKGWFSRAEKTTWTLLQGKELSYNNLLDADSAYRLALDFSDPTVAIIKHTNPCGAASGPEALEKLFERAVEGDRVAAFGGIVGVNRVVDGALATTMGDLFLELVIAPNFDDEARAIFQRKKNLRLVSWADPSWPECEVRSVLGGMLTQTLDDHLGWDALKVVTKRSPQPLALEDLRFAWTVAKHAKSNAIVIARGKQVLGVGAGQMSRVDSVEQAIKKSSPKGLAGAVLASDAFFPFRDNIDRLQGLGIEAIVQPGGSIRDSEVIAACNEHSIAMVLTGTRHFRH